MSNTLEYLAARTGDSELRDYVYSNGYLDVRLFVPDLDAEVVLHARTRLVFTNLSERADPVQRTCYLQLVDLKRELVLDDYGLYVPPADFHQFMRHVRSGLSLAYGHSTKDYSILLCLKGDRPLLGCLLSKLDDATWEQKGSRQQLTNG